MASAHDLFRALSSGNRLEFFAYFNPAAWDAVHPQGPIGIREAMSRSAYAGPQGRGRRGEAVALNPQPLPPMAVGYEQLQRMAWGMIGANDEGAAARFIDDVTDWCGTPWPRKWPWPWPGPWPGPDPDPEPHPDWDEQGMYLGAALAAAQLGARFDKGDMQDVFDKASQALLDRALG